ncbi:DNA-processing protein DprA [Kribbella sp. NPDC051620]|uniref:DNA-processing protein DprA n=1 Tax=Kribbella sp. NPDC051620 TaxID=3364120 RepID=UPI0037927153
MEDALSGLDAFSQAAMFEQAADLRSRSIEALLYGDDDYPASLVHNGRPVAPVLFLWGERRLLTAHGIGMCGSRSASSLGLKAAQSCGQAVSYRNLAVVSGYAKGVDTETHLAALRTGGHTVIVLAEGFNHFKIKQSFSSDFDPRRCLVVSQFPPTQPWGAYAAMARNKIIYGLSDALVVVEAGERGGTRAAGEGALKLGRPVFVLDFGSETPAGNVALLKAGGIPVRSVDELGEVLDRLRSTLAEPMNVQAELPL